MLMMEHVCRYCGEARFVCLEVVERPSSDAIVVASGSGTIEQATGNRVESLPMVELRLRHGPSS